MPNTKGLSRDLARFVLVRRDCMGAENLSNPRGIGSRLA